MYESNKIIDKTHFEVVQQIDTMGFWDEVIDLIVGAYGIVARVIH